MRKVRIMLNISSLRSKVSSLDPFGEQHVDLSKGEALGLGDPEERPDETQGGRSGPEESGLGTAKSARYCRKVSMTYPQFHAVVLSI